MRRFAGSSAEPQRGVVPARLLGAVRGCEYRVHCRTRAELRLGLASMYLRFYEPKSRRRSRDLPNPCHSWWRVAGGDKAWGEQFAEELCTSGMSSSIKYRRSHGPTVCRPDRGRAKALRHIRARRRSERTRSSCSLACQPGVTWRRWCARASIARATSEHRRNLEGEHE